MIEEYALIFSNWTAGPVLGWPKSIASRIPVGLSSSSKEVRQECLSLAYDEAEIHIRILFCHLKSTDELYAWVSDTD